MTGATFVTGVSCTDSRPTDYRHVEAVVVSYFCMYAMHVAEQCQVYGRGYTNPAEPTFCYEYKHTFLLFILIIASFSIQKSMLSEFTLLENGKSIDRVHRETCQCNSRV